MGTAFDVLARLFLIGEPVPIEAAREALAPLPPEQWAAGGLVAVDGDRLVGRGRDPSAGRPGELPRRPRPAASVGPVAADHVLGVSASTAALAGATIRRPIEAAFDLGTGCGVQAVYAAAHSSRVVASDINPRRSRWRR